MSTTDPAAQVAAIRARHKKLARFFTKFDWQMEVRVEDLEQAHADRGELLNRLDRAGEDWMEATRRAGYSDLLTPSGLETVLRDLQANVRACRAEMIRLGRIVEEKDQHLDSARQRAEQAEAEVARLRELLRDGREK